MPSIDDVKARIDIVDLAAEAGVKLRRSGKNYTGFCPFHSNTRTPAFVIWPDSGTWRCFGECNEGGDIFKFVMKREGWDFPEALRHLARRAGVELEQFTPQQAERRDQNERLRTLLEDALTFYRHQLLQTPGGKPALDYLKEKRGLTDATLEAFGLGYAPAGWDNTLNHFRQKNYTEQDLLDVGLVTERESGGYYDKFRNRIMIPIRDAEGRMAGFGARILDPNDTPKFMNSPQTALFDKGHLLYGLDRARRPIRTADQAVIVEGYLDVIAVHQAGFENVVSPMGTALTEDQLRLLKRFTRHIVLALDPDAAGQKAVLRGLDAARAALDQGEELRFDSRGLLRHEARLQADLRVAEIPDGLDPDEIVARSPDEWKTLIEKARPVVVHVMETLIASRSAEDPKTRSEIVAQVLPLIEDLTSPVERETYRQMLARRLRVDERALIGVKPAGSPARRYRRAEAPPQPGPEKPAAHTPASIPSPTRKMGDQVLSILLQNPELLHRLDRMLQEAGLSALSPEDFGYTDQQILLGLARQALEQDAAEVPQFVQGRLVGDLQAVFAGLRARALQTGLKDKLVDEMGRLVLQMRRLTITEGINQLRFLMEDAHQSNDSNEKIYLDLHAQYARSRNYLDLAARKFSGYRHD